MNHLEKNTEATIYVGNLDERVDDNILWELMLQAGPVKSINIPKDRVTQLSLGFAFCEFATSVDAEYAVRIMNLVKLYGKPIRTNKATTDRKDMDVGATLFIGNLDYNV